MAQAVPNFAEKILKKGAVAAESLFEVTKMRRR